MDAVLLLSRALFGLPPADVPTYAAVAALQVLVAIAASALPAWRAGQSDPIESLRAE